MARCPKTAAEAFKRLDKRLSEGEKNRNYWIHTGERENLESLLKDVGEPEFLIGDMASSAILDAYQKHLKE